MDNRIDLQRALEGIVKNVYYQPPASVRMTYPCVRYSRVTGIERNANNKALYIDHTGYDMVYITVDVDDEVIEKIRRMPYCKFNRMYTKDNLYHYCFKIYI